MSDCTLQLSNSQLYLDMDSSVSEQRDDFESLCTDGSVVSQFFLVYSVSSKPRQFFSAHKNFCAVFGFHGFFEARLDVLKSFTATPTLPLASPALCCPRCLKAAVQFGAFSQKSVRKKVRPACFVVVSKWFKLLKIRRMLAGPGVKNLYAFKSLAYFETTK